MGKRLASPAFAMRGGDRDAAAGHAGEQDRGALDDLDHAFAVEHAGDVVGDGGADLAFPARRQIAEQRKGEFPADGGECVAVEEKERRPAMKGAKLIEGLGERQRLGTERFPVCRARRSSFRVNSMLCWTSLARSSVDADDSVPVPVFEKFGSGLKR